MNDKILKALKNKKLTLVQIAHALAFSDYTKEVFQAVDNMVNAGKIERSWDESGMSFYSIA